MRNTTIADLINHNVPGFGTYQYNQDLYDEAMARTVPDLLAEVLEQVRYLDKGSVTKARKLRKADLAAMVAEWSTGARDNERYSAQMDALQADLEAGTSAERLADKQSDAELIEFVKDTARTLAPSQEKVTTAPATGPAITVVVKVGRKLVMGEIIATVNRPMAMLNPNLVAVRHLTDAGHPRVTLHSPKEVAC